MVLVCLDAKPQPAKLANPYERRKRVCITALYVTALVRNNAGHGGHIELKVHDESCIMFLSLSLSVRIHQTEARTRVNDRTRNGVSKRLNSEALALEVTANMDLAITVLDG